MSSKRNQGSAARYLCETHDIPINQNKLSVLGLFGHGPNFTRNKYGEKQFDDAELDRWAREEYWPWRQQQDAA